MYKKITQRDIIMHSYPCHPHGHAISRTPFFCSLTSKLLLALISTVILVSEFHGTHDRILLSDGSGSLRTHLNAPWLQHYVLERTRLGAAYTSIGCLIIVLIFLFCSSLVLYVCPDM
jgi:hypothetical protein